MHFTELFLMKTYNRWLVSFSNFFIVLINWCVNFEDFVLLLNDFVNLKDEVNFMTLYSYDLV